MLFSCPGAGADLNFCCGRNFCKKKNNIKTTSEFQKGDKIQLSIICKFSFWGLGFGSLMQLSGIFQLYHGSQFYWWRKPEDAKKTTVSHWQIYHIILYRVHSPWTGFKLTTLVVIGTDFTGSCKSNYHTITGTALSSDMCDTNILSLISICDNVTLYWRNLDKSLINIPPLISFAQNWLLMHLTYQA